MFNRELKPNTTHLICGSKTGQKFEKATTKPDKLSLVTPDFVTDCVKQKTLLPVTIYHPRLGKFYIKNTNNNFRPQA